MPVTGSAAAPTPPIASPADRPGRTNREARADVRPESGAAGVNLRTRRAALYAIAILASVNALGEAVGSR
jgi:hypothetical protein